jgi:membrane-associated phospholipid phosphatase
MRGIGVAEFLQSLFGPLAPLFALVTQLGDVWLTFTVVAVIYWLGDRTPIVGSRLDRQRTVVLVALALGTLSLTTGLKEFLQLPRPPGASTAPAADALPTAVRPAYEWAASADGFGFPSGHAVRSTVVWGGLASLVTGGDRRRRLVLAGGVVSLVSLSRLVLGLHYAMDVLAGIALGLVYLETVLRWADTPRRAFALVAALAVLGTALNGFTFDGTRILGVTLGAVLTWVVIERAQPHAPELRRWWVPVVAGLPLVGGPFVALEWLGAPLPVAFAVSALLAVGLLALPLVVERAEKNV